MKLKTLTWDDFKQYNPCYDPHERYGDWQGTIIDLLNRNDISPEDKIWASRWILDDETLQLFAVYCARDVQYLMNDNRSLNALQVAERYAINQATEDELYSAWKAAWAAAKITTSLAKDAAARAASSAALKPIDAALYAPGAAAEAAAWAAVETEGNGARKKAWETARVTQIKRLILMIQNA